MPKYVVRCPNCAHALAVETTVTRSDSTPKRDRSSRHAPLRAANGRADAAVVSACRRVVLDAGAGKHATAELFSRYEAETRYYGVPPVRVQDFSYVLREELRLRSFRDARRRGFYVDLDDVTRILADTPERQAPVPPPVVAATMEAEAADEMSRPPI